MANTNTPHNPRSPVPLAPDPNLGKSSTDASSSPPDRGFWSDGPSLDELAARQSIRPIKSFDELKADFWPDDETADEFCTTIRRWRDEN